MLGWRRRTFSSSPTRNVEQGSRRRADATSKLNSRSRAASSTTTTVRNWIRSISNSSLPMFTNYLLSLSSIAQPRSLFFFWFRPLLLILVGRSNELYGSRRSWRAIPSSDPRINSCFCIELCYYLFLVLFLPLRDFSPWPSLLLLP